MKRIKEELSLKVGQTILDENGDKFEVEVGDKLVEGSIVRNLETWADERETSIEVAYGIADYAVYDDLKMSFIWGDPSDEQVNSIMDYAFNESSDNKLFWGDQTYYRKDFR